MPNITTCSWCSTLYEASSEETANEPNRLCRSCQGRALSPQTKRALEAYYAAPINDDFEDEYDGGEDTNVEDSEMREKLDLSKLERWDYSTYFYISKIGTWVRFKDVEDALKNAASIVQVLPLAPQPETITTSTEGEPKFIVSTRKESASKRGARTAMSVPQAVCPNCGRVSKALAHCKYCDEFVPITLALTLADYLCKVSEYWAEDATACKRCEHYYGPDYCGCGMLHDKSVPDGDCLGLLERDGAHQPSGDKG